MHKFIEELKDFTKKCDWVLLILCMITSGFGTVVIASATNAEKFGDNNIKYIIIQLAATALGLGTCGIGAFQHELCCRLFGLDGKELIFTDDAIETVAALAIERGTGARGLRSIMEEVMLPISYEAPSMDDVEAIVVNGKVVSEHCEPEYRLKATE